MGMLKNITDEINRICNSLDCNMFLSDKERDKLLIKIGELCIKKDNYNRIINQDQKDK